MEDFVTIMTVTYPHEVAVIKARLESEGIDCYLKDEMSVQVYNLASNAMGGVKLQVREKDREDALTILQEAGYLKEEIHEPLEFSIPVDGFFSSLHKNRKKIIIAVILLIIVVWVIESL